MKILFTLVITCAFFTLHAQETANASASEKLKDTATFVKVEKDASFPGGDAAWK